jgi:hypothetical protein
LPLQAQQASKAVSPSAELESYYPHPEGFSL